MKLSTKLLIWFSVVSVTIATVAIGISSSFFRTKQQASELSAEINDIYFKFLKLKNTTNDFFALETIDTSFYKTQKSDYLDSAHKQNANIREGLQHLISKNKRSNSIINSLKDIESALKKRDSIFAMLSVFAMERGYKDFGKVGNMRYFAHELEKLHFIDKTQLLTLRRKEKDYLLRHEDSYIESFKNICNEIYEHLSSINKNENITQALKYLDNYKKEFLKVSQFDKKMGLHDNRGLKGELNNVDRSVEEKIKETLRIADYNQNRTISQLEKTFLLTVSFTLLVCFFLANILSRQVTRPLSRLTRFIEGIMINDFRSIPKLVKSINTLEIKILYREFSLMIEQLKQNQQEKDVLINQLTAGEKKYRDMADSLPQGLFETDNRGVLIYVNKVWQEYFGYSKVNAEFNLNIFDIINRRKKSNSKRKKNEVIAYRKDKTWFPALLYMDKIKVGDNLKGWRGVIIDISERYEYINLLKKEQRKAMESDRLKSAFLANISHEIRTPINAIMGFSTILKNKDHSIEERQAYLDIIEKSSLDLLNVFEDMIAVSRMESDEHRLNIENVDLALLANEILDMAKIKAKEMDKELLEIQYSQLQEEEIKVVSIDKMRITEIFERLIENAIKFTSQGGIQIGHKLMTQKIVFFVKDSGIGVPKEKHKIIFDPFRQVDESNSKTNGGTGLGLAICQGLVNQMDGNIWIESKPGEGSGLFFSIPYKPENQTNCKNPLSKLHNPI